MSAVTDRAALAILEGDAPIEHRVAHAIEVLRAALSGDELATDAGATMGPGSRGGRTSTQRNRLAREKRRLATGNATVSPVASPSHSVALPVASVASPGLACPPRAPVDISGSLLLSERFQDVAGFSESNGSGLLGSKKTTAQSAREPVALPVALPVASVASVASPLSLSSPKQAKSDRGAKAGHRIPADWSPSPDTVRWAIQQGDIDALACVPEFRDYWVSVAGAKAVKADWEATFRNRVRELVQRGTAPLIDRTPKLLPPTPATPAPDQRPVTPEEFAAAKAVMQTHMDAMRRKVEAIK